MSGFGHIVAGQVGVLMRFLCCLWLQGEDGEFWTDIPNTQIRRVTAKRLLEAKQVSQWRLRVVCQVLCTVPPHPALPCWQAERL